MRMLYIGPLNYGGTCRQRLESFQRIGLTVDSIDTSINSVLKVLIFKILRRFGIIADLVGANRKIIDKCQLERNYGIVWVDKGLILDGKTINHIYASIPSVKVISYSPDDMFNPANQSRRYLEAISLYSCHVTTKSYNVREFYSAGALRVIFVNNAFCPLTHTPRRAAGEEKVAFIGTYEMERFNTLCFLASAGVPLVVAGNWPKQYRKTLEGLGVEVIGRELVGDDYPAFISKYLINLCFLRKVNRDLQTTRSVEISACGSFMLGERTGEHKSLFIEAEEADFFSDNEELLSKIEFYLAHVEICKERAYYGHKRCIENYSNDLTLKYVLNEISGGKEY